MSCSDNPSLENRSLKVETCFNKLYNSSFSRLSVSFDSLIPSKLCSIFGFIGILINISASFLERYALSLSALSFDFTAPFMAPRLAFSPSSSSSWSDL